MTDARAATVALQTLGTTTPSVQAAAVALQTLGQTNPAVQVAAIALMVLVPTHEHPHWGWGIPA